MPKRNQVVRSNGSSAALASSSPDGTPTPRPTRPNPFDAHLSMERLRRPILSPSVFSTVQSPSQDTSGRFWSVDQQANLFPAEISDDSPWKQETATSIMDQETENRTQEAIDLYFSQHHEVLSPEGQVSMSSRPLLRSTKSCIDLGSPMLAGGGCISSSTRVSEVAFEDPGQKRTSQWTQTVITMPPVLPPELEEVLAKFANFSDDQQQRDLDYSLEDQSNMSTSRRKLFDSPGDHSSDEGDDNAAKSILAMDANEASRDNL